MVCFIGASYFRIRVVRPVRSFFFQYTRSSLSCAFLFLRSTHGVLLCAKRTISLLESDFHILALLRGLIFPNSHYCLFFVAVHVRSRGDGILVQ